MFSMEQNILKCKNCGSTDILQTIEGFVCRSCGILWNDDMESSRLTKPKEFKVNDYLSLKLEGNITNIYVKERLFQQCKFLLLNIPIDEITSFDAFESIDEAADKLDRSLENPSSNFIIPPETEFWGHCSNLQVWYENNYDTRLIHSNLAFPLLKRLVEAGDVNAKRVFKEEIVNRYIEGNETVQTYLMEQGYLTNLENEELKLLAMELFEKENYTGLALFNINTIQHIRFRKDEVIDLIFDSNYEFKNWINKFLKERLDAGLFIHRLLLSLFTTSLNKTDEFAKNLYKNGFKKCFLQVDNRRKLELAHRAELQIFDNKEREHLLNFIDFEVINEYQPEEALHILSRFAFYESTKARKFLREKIKKYFDDKNEDLIRHIVTCKYIQYLEPHELNFLLEDFDHTIITEQEVRKPFPDEAYDQLGILAKFGYSKANQILKEEFLKRFKEDQLEGIGFLRKYLDHLKRTELEDFLKDVDYNIILNQDFSHTFNILSTLEELGIPKARRIYKQLYGSRPLVKLFSSMDTSKQESIYEKKLELIRSILPPLEYTFLQELQSLIDKKIQVFIDPTISNSPSIVIKQKRISQIRMERQNIEVIPKSIRNLKSLKILNLNYNQLKALPEEIGEITLLEDLLLIDNSITGLPKTMGKLVHLRYLDLTRNKLDSLPRSIAKLKKVEYLNLNFNNFHNMPKTIGKLESLKYLFFDYNHLHNLPNIFHKLGNLKRIDLQGNRLKTIPRALLKLNSIKKISLSKEFLDTETINLLEPIKKEYSKFVKEAGRKPSIWSMLWEEPMVKPLNILFDKYILRFFYEWGGFTNIFWSYNDEAINKYGYPARLYSLPLSSDIIDKFRSLSMKWQKINRFFIYKEKYDIGSNLEVEAMEKELEVLKNETKDTFLKAIKQLGPNFQVKFQMEGYGLPNER